LVATGRVKSLNDEQTKVQEDSLYLDTLVYLPFSHLRQMPGQGYFIEFVRRENLSHPRPKLQKLWNPANVEKMVSS